MILKIVKDCVLKTNNKNHQDVFNRLTVVENKELSHVAFGLASELGEVVQALRKNDPVNLIEELGDLMWYVGLAELTINPNVNEVAFASTPKKSYSITDETRDSVFDLVIHVSELVDLVKKKAFYGKEIKPGAMESEIENIKLVVSKMADGIGADLQTVCEVMCAKLMKRYAGGYTDKKAIERNVEVEREIMEDVVDAKK